MRSAGKRDRETEVQDCGAASFQDGAGEMADELGTIPDFWRTSV